MTVAFDESLYWDVFDFGPFYIPSAGEKRKVRLSLHISTMEMATDQVFLHCKRRFGLLPKHRYRRSLYHRNVSSRRNIYCDRTILLNAKNEWERIEGEGQLYITKPGTNQLEPSDDLTTPGIERRYVLTLNDIPRYTVFYDDNLMLLRLWGIGRDSLCTAY